MNPTVVAPPHLRITERMNGHYRTADGGWLKLTPRGWAYGSRNLSVGAAGWWLDLGEEQLVDGQVMALEAQAVQAAQAYIDSINGRLGHRKVDARQALEKARRYTELLPAYYDNPRIALEDGEFRQLDLYFAVLNWNESTIRNLAGV